MGAELATIEACCDKPSQMKHGMMQKLLTGRVQLLKLSKGETTC